MRKGISRRELLKGIVAGTAVGAFSSLNSCNKKKADKPNIIFMVADNLGRESVGYYGRKNFKTPNIDKLASEGVIFENCLIATPLCAPARCSWNAGRHPYRIGVNNTLEPDDPESGLSPEEITIAEVLKKAGYYTAQIGKWQVGYDKKFNPINQGFDEFYGSTSGSADYYTHVYTRSGGRSHFFRDLEPLHEEGYFDKLFTDEAVKFLQARKKSLKPFYLNLCFYAPHGPYQAPPGYYHSEDQDVNYQYMIEYLDLCVKRVLEKVDRLGLAENTLIVFMSDQGGSHVNHYGRTLWETGLKVVCSARWKGRIPSGIRVHTPWMHYDVFTTFAALAGAPIPSDRVIDSQDIWPVFQGKELEQERTFFWTYKNEDAIRTGEWKLHMTDGKVDGLFNLAEDPNEKKDLSGQYPDRVKKMLQMHSNWKTECESQQTSTSKSGKKYPIPNHNNSY